MRKLVLALVCFAVLGTLGWFMFTSGAPESRQVALSHDEPQASQEPDARADLPGDLAEIDATSEQAPIADARTAVTAQETAQENGGLRLVDAAGAAVAGAKVRVYRDPTKGQILRFKSAQKVDRLMDAATLEYLSDGSGTVPIGPLNTGEKLLVEARKGELWGKLMLVESSDRTDHELVMQRDITIAARVVDPKGHSVGGVPVVLESSGGRWSRRVLATKPTKESTGQVVFDHAQLGLGSDSALRLRLDVLAPEPIQTSIDLEQLSREPIVLILPASGSVTVKVLDHDWETYMGEARATLRVLDEGASRDISPFNHDPNPTVFAPVEAGLAHFDFVVTGFEVQARVYRELGSVPGGVIAKGPTVAGSTVNIDVRLGADNPVLRLRALRSDGAPIADTKLEVNIHVLNEFLASALHCWPITDERGVFFVDLPRYSSDGQEISLIVNSSVNGGLECKLDLPENLDVGLTDLGDIVLREPKVFVGGIVTGPGGQPVAAAKLFVRSQGAEDAAWQIQNNVEESTDSEGRFTIKKVSPGVRFQIAAEAKGLSATWTGFVAGETNLNVSLHAEGRVTGLVLLNEGISPELLQLTIATLGDTDEYLGYRSRTVSPDAEGRFSFGHLVPGRTRSIRVSAKRQSRVILNIDDLIVNSGETTVDARCNPIDLRGKLFLHEVELVQPSGGGSINGSVGFRPAGAEKFDDGLWLDGSEFSLLTGTEAVDFSIEASGYRRELLLDQRGDVRVKLREAIKVTLILPEGVELPESPVYVKAGLVPVDGAGGFDYSGNAFDEAREITTRVGAAGQLRVVWVVERRSANSSMAMQYNIEREQLVDVLDTEGEQRILLELTQEEMDKLAAAL